MQQIISPMRKRVWRGSKRPAAAICTVKSGGKSKQVTLGVWGSKEALEAYKRLTAEATATDACSGGVVTIATLCARFYADAEARAMAGHTTINMTAHYEHTAERLKTDLASKRAAYCDSSN